MSDELNVWRDAMLSDSAQTAAAVIRSYGDERHAAGYQAAIADVVAMIGEQFDAPHIADVAGRIANEITRRFGKGQDHG